MTNACRAARQLAHHPISSHLISLVELGLLGSLGRRLQEVFGAHLSVSVSPEEYRILELFSFYGNVVLALLKGDTAVTRPLHTSCVGEVHLLHTKSIWDLAEVLEEATSQMSSGSTSPDLRDAAVPPSSEVVSAGRALRALSRTRTTSSTQMYRDKGGGCPCDHAA